MIDLNFKWKYDQHFPAILFQLFYPVFFPCPHLWADIPYNRDAGLVECLGQHHIESGVVDQHYCIRAFGFGLIYQIFEYSYKGENMLEYLQNTYNIQFG